MTVSKLAQKIIDAYAHDPEGLTAEECESLGLSDEQTEVLYYVLRKGAEGTVTDEERGYLASAGFESEFIEGIAGADGNRALRERAKWLGDHVVRKFGQRDYRNSIREKFVRELGDIGHVAESAVPALIVQMERGNPEAILALGRIGPAAKSVVPALIAVLKDNRDGSDYAAMALGDIGPGAKEAVPVLIAALKDDERVRIDPRAKEAVPALIAALEDKFVRRNAAEALGKIGPVTADVIPALLVALRDQDDDVRCAAAEALGMIGPSVIPALIKLLKEENSYARSAAALALGNIGSDAKAAVPALIEALKRDNDGRIIIALCKIDPDAKAMVEADTTDTVPVLIEALKNKDEDVRKSAVVLLGRIGPDAKAAVPALIKALRYEDEYESVRKSAIVALGRIGLAAVPALFEVMNERHKSKDIRKAVAEVLGRLSFATKCAVADSSAAQDSFECRVLSAQLEAVQKLPYELFSGVGFVFSPEGGGGEYGSIIVLRGSNVDLSSIAHELAHHWDLTLFPGEDSLFNKISWRDVDTARYINGREFISLDMRVVPDRDDFDRSDFTDEYGLCNPNEDLATIVEGYVSDGWKFRSRIRKQMDSGNFELAAKYLFVKHVMLFKSKEYGVDDESPALTIEEVKEKYLTAKDTFKTDHGTWDVILEIEKQIRKP